MNAFEKMRLKEGDAAVALALLLPLLEYQPLTGLLIWRQDRGTCFKAGSIAGCLRKDGYIKVIVKGRPYMAHRLAFLFMTGTWPEGQVDHGNGVRSDNRWLNLKDTDQRGNSSNTPKHRDGHPVGVYFERRTGKWRAQIKDQGVTFRLGSFPTAAEASFVYQMALKDLQYGYAQMAEQHISQSQEK